MKQLRAYIAMLLAAATVIGAVGCSTPVKAADLMSGVSPNSVIGKSPDAAFADNMADFSVELFKSSIDDSKNSLISPLSVMLALAMAANGADGVTLAQMQGLLCGARFDIGELNEYLFSYAKQLPNYDKSKLEIANSIWFRNDGDKLKVNAGFLQTNADYYSAEAYSSAFDDQTVKDINKWVNTSTNGMIKEIIKEIEPNDLLYLINAVMFDAEWQSVYNKENIRDGVFTDIQYNEKKVDFMHSTEGKYLDDGMATGFIKPYAKGDYSFAALLPNKDIAIQDYIRWLSGASFLDTINNAQDTRVIASMPKFKYEYDIEMSDILAAMGGSEPFDADRADFGKMAGTTIGNGNIYISKVVHKTFISVDELGTKAGAVTMVAMAGGSSAPPEEPKIVNLDRPFVYAIIDNATNVPIFIGTLMSV